MSVVNDVRLATKISPHLKHIESYDIFVKIAGSYSEGYLC
jgi:hypothetical protein